MSTANDLRHYVRAMAKCARPNRTHEECAGCAFEAADPPQCLGHYQGPVACPMFVRKGTMESRLVAIRHGCCNEEQVVPVEHPHGADWTDEDAERYHDQKGT